MHPRGGVDGKTDAQLVDGTQDEADLDVGAGSVDVFLIVEIVLGVAVAESVGGGIVDQCLRHAFGVVRLGGVLHVHDAYAHAPVDDVGYVAGEVDVVFVDMAELVHLEHGVAVGIVLEETGVAGVAPCRIVDHERIKCQYRQPVLSGGVGVEVLRVEEVVGVDAVGVVGDVVGERRRGGVHASACDAVERLQAAVAHAPVERAHGAVEVYHAGVSEVVEVGFGLVVA